MIPCSADIAVLGGGIAGLWTLARLRAAGYHAVLLEAAGLGGVQTIASQGIIHGGAKYSLTGSLTESARAIAEMPGIWRAALAGHGELDLSRVRVLSDHQYLWSTEGIGSRITGFFAGKAMRSRMAPVAPEQRPGPFLDPRFHGDLYRLDEPVLDVPSLTAELAAQLGDWCYLCDPDGLRLEAGTDGVLLRMGAVELRVRRLILAAGAGNAALLAALGRNTPEMQLRPLQMVMVRGALPLLYAHCLGTGGTPRITVTSHPQADGRMVWYLGGQLAEAGVGRSEAEQITAARDELGQVLPWLGPDGLEFATLRIQRAEPKSLGGMRPDGCFVRADGPLITTWPTKLAFAPRVASEIMGHLQRQGIAPTGQAAVSRLSGLAHPSPTPPPWERVEQWS